MEPTVEISLKNQIRAREIVSGLNEGKTYTQIAEEMQLSRTALYAIMNKTEVQALMVSEVTSMETEAQRMIRELDESQNSANKRHALTELGKMIRHTKDKLYPTIFRTETTTVNINYQHLQALQHILTETLNRFPPTIRENFWETYNAVKQEYDIPA